MKKFFIPHSAGCTIVLIGLMSFLACGGTKLTQTRYPEGYSLLQPKGWMARVADRAYVLVSSPETSPTPAFLLVYPFFLKNVLPANSWLTQNLPLMSKYLPNAVIEKTQQLRTRPDECAMKFRFEKSGVAYAGLALCSIYEKSGILYIAAAKADAFESVRPVLKAMIQSFRFGTPEAGPTAKPKLQYVNWSDPKEQAFSLDVPQGWQVQGGTYRRASVDLVHVLQAVSPDQNIRIQYNDANIPAFVLPNQTLAWSGFPEGSWYSPGYGVRNLVKRYLPGRQFLKEYLGQNYQPRLSGFTYVSEKDRPDIVAEFNRIYSSSQTYGVQVSMHAGEAAFRFSQDGTPFVGYGLALTQLVYMPSMNGGNWNVALLLVYTCPDSEAQTVQDTASHMFMSVKMNPQWVAGQQQLTANVSQIVTQTSQAISKIIDDAYWTRQGAMDNINRKFSNYILGVTDVVDPETGQTWKVEAGHNFYWTRGAGDVVAGTQTYTRPDIDFKPLFEIK
jgi:hypothetical protein